MLQVGRRRDAFDPGETRQALGQGAQPLAAEPAQPGGGLDRGETGGFAGRDVEGAGGREALRIVQLDQRRQDRLGALERQRQMTAVGQPAEHGAVVRQRFEAGLARAPQPGHGSLSTGSSATRSPSTTMPEIERKPPAAIVFETVGAPVAAAVDDAVAEAVLEFYAPALAHEQRHRLVDKARPFLVAFRKAEGELAGVRLEPLERLQPQSLQPSLGRTLGRGIAVLNNDFAADNGAQFARRRRRLDQGAAIVVGEQRDIDRRIPVARQHPPIAPHPRAAGNDQHRHRRVRTHLLDQIDARARQRQPRQFAFEGARPRPTPRSGSPAAPPSRA